ncbi:MAG: DNA-binding protein [Caulobacteraceae bacterium]|nr:DNA-binding protein [Caulobacteraceae bacterium]
MPGKPRKWPPRGEVVAVVEESASWDEVAERLNIPRTTIQAYCRRNQIESPASRNHVLVDGEHVISDDVAEWGDLEKLLENRGLNKTEWRILRARVNRWQEHDQLRVDLEPVGWLPRPARSEGWKPPRDRASRKVKNGLIALMGDFHAPHHDRDLFEMTVRWVRDHKPERIIILGDLMDYGSTVSRHSKTGFEPSIQDNIESAYGILRALKSASPGTCITLLDGNHEARMQTALESRGLVPLAHLTRADDPVPVLSTRNLLRLDELEVETVDNPVKGGGYEFTETRVCDGLVARHGHIAKTGAGASVRTHVERLSRSIVIGHVHRLAVIRVTQWPDGVERQLVGVEAGCMAEIKDGLGYASAGAADWQQGFAVCQVLDDRFTVDLAVYTKGVLTWRDWACR